MTDALIWAGKASREAVPSRTCWNEPFPDSLEPPAVSTVPAGQTPAFMLWARFFMQTLRIPTAFLRTNGLPRSTRAFPEPSGLPMRNTFLPVSMPGSAPREKPTVTAFHAHPSSTLLTPGWPGTARWHGAWIFWNRRYTYSGERMTSLLLPPCAAMNRALFRRVTSAEPSRRHKWHRQGNMSSSPLPERASSTKWCAS